MDADSTAFVVDRLDVARIALLEAKQTLEKFSEPEDAEIGRQIDAMLAKVEQLDSRLRAAPRS